MSPRRTITPEQRVINLRIAFRIWSVVAVFMMLSSIAWTCFVLQSPVSQAAKNRSFTATAFLVAALGSVFIFRGLSIWKLRRKRRDHEQWLAQVSELKRKGDQRRQGVRGPRDARALWKELQEDYPLFRDCAKDYARAETALVLACLDATAIRARFTISRAEQDMDAALNRVVLAFAAVNDLPSAQAASSLLHLSSVTPNEFQIEWIQLPGGLRRLAVQIIRAKLAVQLKLLDVAAFGNQLMDLMNHRPADFGGSLQQVDAEQNLCAGGRNQFQELLTLLDNFLMLIRHWERQWSSVDRYTAKQLDAAFAMPFVEPLSMMLRELPMDK